MAVDILSEILICGLLEADGNKKNNRGCFIWLLIFGIALGAWVGYEFLINK